MFSGMRSAGLRSLHGITRTPLPSLLLPYRFQRPRRLIPASRSIWLFSSKPAPVDPPPAPAPPSELLVADDAPPVIEAVSPPDLPIQAMATPDALSDSIIPYSSTFDTIAAAAPLQYGDLAALGIAGWSPAGLAVSMLEWINVTTGMPWFYTIIAGTVLSRALILPLSVKQMRNSARLAPHQPRLMALKEEAARASANRDPLAVQRVSLKQRKVYEEAGVSMLPMLAMPFVQLPVTLGMFFGVKRMCALPVEQLHWSGVSFLPDLTVADPYYILPILSAIAMNVQLSVGASDMAATADRTTMANMINAFRVVSVISIPFMGGFASGLNLYVLTGIVAMLAQTVILRNSAVRRLFGIPILQKVADFKPVRLQESIVHLKKYFKEQNEASQKKAAQRKW